MLGLVRLHEPEDLPGTEPVSRANQTAAFFKICLPSADKKIAIRAPREAGDSPDEAGAAPQAHYSSNRHHDALHRDRSDGPSYGSSAHNIRVSAPEDCILNAQPPYPTGGRHVTGHMVVPLVFRTLADAVPGQVQADCGNINIVTFQGTNPGGRPMSTIYFSTGGFGALQGLDGADTVPGPSNMRAVPTEMWESLTGITILHKRLLPDSGGHGEARGGLGQEIEFRNDTGAPLGVSGARAVRRRRRKPAEHPD